MSKRRNTVVLGTLVLALGTGWLASRFAAAETATPERVHTDGKAMAEGVVQAFDALLREDLVAARVAIKRLQTSCRPLNREADEIFAPGFRNRDQALHKVLNGTMGYIADGEPEAAYTEFVWVTRTCRECHALARDAGLLPKTRPLWPAAVGGSKRVETTHTAGEKP